MAKKDTNQHLAILQDIRNKVFKPVYLPVSYTHLTLPTIA